MSKTDEAFYGGICAALAVVTMHDNDVVWREIVDSVGATELLDFATRDDALEWAGFNKYSDELAELLGGSHE